MILYVYESIPQPPGARVRHYMLKQNPGEAPLTTHPQTGELIRRVVLGELGELTVPDHKPPAAEDSNSSSSSGCGRLPWLR